MSASSAPSAPSDVRPPHLVVLAPLELRGRTLVLGPGNALVGRSPACQLVLDDPRVSRTHAVVRAEGEHAVVEDLGSRGGTAVNGVVAAGATPVRDGDVLTFASVTARFEAGDVAGGGAMGESTAVAARFDLRDQQAGVINNVGRDQYNAYVSQRDSFLREVAAAKTKAKIVAWLGLALAVLGQVLGGGAVVSFIQKIVSLQGSTSFEDFRGLSPLGPDIAGIPMFVIGMALSLLGSLMVIVGVVQHVVAASRKRRIERDMPLQASLPRRIR